VERALQATSARLRQTHELAAGEQQRAAQLAADLESTRKHYEQALGELTEQCVLLAERLHQKDKAEREQQQAGSQPAVQSSTGAGGQLALLAGPALRLRGVRSPCGLLWCETAQCFTTTI
jgi:hypothetical protein